MNSSLTEEEKLAQQDAINDYAEAHPGRVVTDEILLDSIDTTLDPLPVCQDFDRFAHHLR
jgi:hypothetical protein